MSNPLVNESIVEKVKTKIGGKKKEDTTTESKSIEYYFVGMNNAIPVCAEACACCWDKKVPEGYSNVAEYVAKRSRTGHTSIIEHSNFVVLLIVGKNFEDELISFLDTAHYLYTRTVPSDDGTKFYVLIGGSYRGYCDLYRETDDLNNPILKAVTGLLYTYGNSAAFEDICKLGLMDKSMFLDVEPGEKYDLITDNSKVVDNDLFKVINIDSMSKLYKNIYRASPEAAKKFTTYDLCKFTTITILFKNMSRTCTHQLVRHRNAITQESQRYVDYSHACFNSPALFKPDKYDANHKYKIRFGPSAQLNMTLDEIGEAMCGIYGMLYDPAIAGKEYALLKEDARAFLPSNVQCKKIYMTFTFKSFLKFLNLREDPAAQAEIRKYATGAGDWLRSSTEFNTKELCDLYTQPRLLVEDPIHIDVDLGFEDETFDMNDEDYIKAAGLDKEDKSEKEDNKEEN